MHKLIFIYLFCNSMIIIGQTQKETSKWIGKSNRILNPGAELNSQGSPLHWKSNYTLGAESNWVSEYGTTSHEWNHGDKKLGLPTNPGNNYFRLNVNKYDETRILNLFQYIPLDDILNALKTDTIIADFQAWIGVNYPNSSNCAFTEVKLVFINQDRKELDSIYIKKTPGEFRDLDAGTPEADERGFNVMHELQVSKISLEVPKDAKQAFVKIQCEFPCAKFIGEDQDETEGEFTNTFFFDNLSLGFHKK